MAPTIDIPETLGRGVNSIGLKRRGDPITRQNLLPSSVQRENLQLIYIDSYDTLYNSLNLDVQASFGGLGADASISSSFARSITITDSSIHFLLRIAV